MTRTLLSETVAGVSSLRGLFVTTMPDCLLFDMWMRNDESWNAEDVAAYFGDLVRSNRAGLKALGSWSSEMSVTIESADRLVILREMGEHFVVGMVFAAGSPLGMVRLNVRQLMERLAGALPTYEAVERPRAVRAIEFLERYAPDPHAVLMRLSLKTGFSVEQLGRPEDLDPDDGSRLEEAIKDILGLDSLAIS